MADAFGPTPPAEPDPVDERLRHLARDTEPLVVLAGPAAARRRGERRTARRRAGAVGLVAALALGLGSWQLLPRLGSGGSAALPAATAPAPATGEALVARLRDELLPPQALPLYPKVDWVVVPDALAAAKYPETCPVSRLASTSLAEAGRVYRSPGGAVAHYRLYAMPSVAAAQHQARTLDGLIKGKCGWAEGLDYDKPALPTGAGSQYRGQLDTVWLEHEGAYIALLDISTAAGKVTNGYADAAPWPGVCIVGSLARLSAGTARDGAPAATGASGVGSGTSPGFGTSADPAADPAAGSAGTPPATPLNHC